MRTEYLFGNREQTKRSEVRTFGSSQIWYLQTGISKTMLDSYLHSLKQKQKELSKTQKLKDMVSSWTPQTQIDGSCRLQRSITYLNALGRKSTPVPTKALPRRKLALRGVTVPRTGGTSTSSADELELSSVA